MHQGNLRSGINGELIVLDFGIMGRIDLYTRRIYAQILNGFINKNYRKVAEVHFEAGYISFDQDIDKFAQALRSHDPTAATCNVRHAKEAGRVSPYRQRLNNADAHRRISRASLFVTPYMLRDAG